jgi:hypothetical protein
MPHRSFRDKQGRAWDAWEVVPTAVERRMAGIAAWTKPAEDRRKVEESRVLVPTELQRGWLAFQSGTERRRLTPIPDHWDILPDARLEELLEQAGRRTRARR